MNGTIHIFGYGEAQVISETVNFKTGVDKLSTLQAVIDNVKSKKPSDNTVSDYHAINIFSDLRADYIAKRLDGAKPGDKDTSSFSVDFKDLDGKKLDDLVAEFAALSKE